MTTTPSTTCYRHTDRETGRRCTRCGRPACPDCLRDASVGAHCVDCVNAAAPSASDRVRHTVRGQNLIATKSIIAVTAVMYLLTSFPSQVRNHWYIDLLLFGPAVHQGDWWRLFTSALLHENILHILFNMLVLYQVGRVLEPGAGSARFTTLYVVSVLAGSAGALVLTPHAATVGASGGVIGVAAAATLVMHRQGVSFWNTGFGPLIIFVLAEPLWIPNVSMGGHLGGVVGGALATEAMLQARKANQPWLGYAGAAFVGLASILLAFAVAGN